MENEAIDMATKTSQSTVSQMADMTPPAPKVQPRDLVQTNGQTKMEPKVQQVQPQVQAQVRPQVAANVTPNVKEIVQPLVHTQNPKVMVSPGDYQDHRHQPRNSKLAERSGRHVHRTRSQEDCNDYYKAQSRDAEMPSMARLLLDALQETSSGDGAPSTSSRETAAEIEESPRASGSLAEGRPETSDVDLSEVLYTRRAFPKGRAEAATKQEKEIELQKEEIRPFELETFGMLRDFQMPRDAGIGIHEHTLEKARRHLSEKWMLARENALLQGSLIAHKEHERILRSENVRIASKVNLLIDRVARCTAVIKQLTDAKDTLTRNKRSMEKKLVAFKQELDDLKNAIPRYSISSEKPGFVLIIRNTKFKTLDKREGTKEESLSLMTAFEEDLGFTTSIQGNLRGEEMKGVIRDIATNPKYKAYSSIVVVLSSHGRESGILGVDEEPVPESFISQTLGHSETLRDKPKLVLVQACRGINRVEEVGNPLDDAEDVADDGPREPAGLDLIIAHATTPGHTAPRHNKSGSYFFQKFCQVLGTYAATMHVCDMLKVVTEGIVAEHSKSKPKKKLCIPNISYNSLRKKFYFTE